MSKEAYMRHDISDKVWGLLAPILPGRSGMWGGIATDNRQFINAVIWILRTGAPWRDLPPEYGPWKTVYNRYNNWSKKGHIQSIMDELKKRWRSRMAHA